MKTTNQMATQPYANICINKSRLKIYNKESDPTYYLQKDSEFEIELFNPTNNVVLAKIILNGKTITQGGLVLRPAERVFLERYIDVAKKFKFDTYEVSNTEETKQAIKDNGNFKVEFYHEYIPIYNPIVVQPYYYNNPSIFYHGSGTGITTAGGSGTFTIDNSVTTNSFSGTLTNSCNSNNLINCSASLNNNVTDEPLKRKLRTRTCSLNSTKMETGRVEMGSDSTQQFNIINKQFNSWAFHIVEYKLLPISQKVNTTDDINVRQYCGGCGLKITKGDNFCSKCGRKH